MHELLRSLWREPRPPAPTPRAWWDWALAAALAVAAVLEGVVSAGLPAPP